MQEKQSFPQSNVHLSNDKVNTDICTVQTVISRVPHAFIKGKRDRWENELTYESLCTMVQSMPNRQKYSVFVCIHIYSMWSAFNDIQICQETYI